MTVQLIGREKLKQTVQETIDSKRSFSTAEQLWEKYDWIINRAEHYAEKTGLDVEAILNAWEEQRDYSWNNFYQDANQPIIKGDNVKVFDTLEDLLNSLGKEGFRCPSCKGVSKNPYTCDSGVKTADKVCDWKSYGLFGTLDNGATVFVKEKFKVETFFMPIAWE